MFTKKFVKNCAVLTLSVFGILGIASCGNANNDNTDNNGDNPNIVVPEEKFYTVSFMVQGENDTWTVLLDKKTTDGKVELPTAPVKQYYTFAGWYTTEALDVEFNENSVKADSNAYAKYIPQEVKIHIDDDPVLTKNLVDIANSTFNPEIDENLDFDGWYKDAQYSVKWNGTDVVKDLYAKSVALITFNNGYEDVYTYAVKPGTVVTNPHETEVDGAEEGTKTTLEAKEIVKPYMDLKDINYVNAEGNPYDFTQAINKSTVITVNWNSVGISNSLQTWEKTKTNFLKFRGFGEAAKTAPVISFQGKVTKTVTEGEGENAVTKDVVYNVDAISMDGDGMLPATAEKIIIGEGVKYIGGLNGGKANSVKEISLPKSLKVIDNCFSEMPKLTGVTLPEGLEVLIGSFFKEQFDHLSSYKHMSLGTNYDFAINVPDSVKNISVAPTNLEFSDNSVFLKGTDNRIYLKDSKGLVLVSDTDNVRNRTVIVPKGIAGIQVGTYEADFDYLVLPESFKFVNHNADISEYPYCDFLTDTGSAWSISYNHFYDAKNAKNPYGSTSVYAVSITSRAAGSSKFGNRDGAGYVIMNCEKAPEGLDAYAFTGDATGYSYITGGYAPFNDPALTNSFIYNDKVQNIYVTLRYEISLDDDGNEKTPDLVLSVNSNAVIETKAIENITELIDAIKAQNPDAVANIDKAIEGKTLELLNGNKVITVDEISGEMFLSINVK